MIADSTPATGTGARIFVTGGSGFLGRRLVSELVAKGYVVRALARSARTEDQMRALGAEPVSGDLEDRDAMARGMAGCAAVIHAAAKVEQWGPWEDFERVTVGGTRQVVEAARQAGVGRLVHISTEAVLAGGQPILEADESTPYPPVANGFYPRSKRLAEEVVRAANGPDLATVIVRPRFIWGRGDTTLLPKLAEAARSGGWVWFGGGRHRMSTCHVANVVAGVLAALEHGQPGATYFLTDGEPVVFRDFIAGLMATQGVQPGGKTAPMWVASLLAASGEAVWKTFGLKGEPPLTRTAVNLFFQPVTVRDDKARRELGYRPVISVAEGLAELAAAGPSPAR